MNKLSIIFLILVSFSLAGCKAKVVPLVGIEINEYELLYEDGYEIYILKEIPNIQLAIGIVIEELKDETCYLVPTTTNAYIVKYEENFISLGNGIELNLFDTYNLMDYGVSFQCHEDE